MADMRTLKLNLLADTQQFRRGLAGAQGASKTFAGRIGASMRTASQAVTAVGVAATYLGVRLGSDLITKASDLNETMNRTTVIFGKNAEQINKFSEIAAKQLGMTKTSAQNAASTFALFGKAAGLTGTKLVNFSTKLTRLAADMASFSNTTPEEAITALGAALRGESEPIRRYGVLLNENAVANQALKMKLADTRAELTDGDKVLARYALILQQTTSAQGDFARTSDGYANSMRILKATIDDVKASLGQAFMDKATEVLPSLQRFIETLAGRNPNSLTANARESRAALGGPEGLATSIREVAYAFSRLYDAVIGAGPEANSTMNATASAIHNVARAINAMASAIEWFQRTANRTNWNWGVGGLQVLAPMLGQFFGRGTLGTLGTRAIGGSVRAGGTYLVGESGPEVVTMGGTGYVTRNGGTAAAGGTTVININGIVDAESARRSIERLIQQSSRRTGAVNWNPVLT